MRSTRTRFEVRTDGCGRRGGTAVVLLSLMFVVACSALAPVTSAEAAPQGEFASLLTFSIASITGDILSAANGDGSGTASAGGPSTGSGTGNGGDSGGAATTAVPRLTVRGVVHNSGPQNLADVQYRFQRGDPLSGEAALRAELAAPQQQTAVITQSFTTLTGEIPAGTSAPFVASVPLTGDGGDTLDLRQPGVYPVMINVNADVSSGSTAEGTASSVHARVGESHLLVSVLSVPPVAPAAVPGFSEPAGPGAAPGQPAGPGAAPGQPADALAVPVTMLWPVVDRPHLGVSGIFLDDDLVQTISPGGRLWSILDGLTAAIAPGAAADTLVVDPELLDELDRMQQGYRVRADRSLPQSALTPVLPTAPVGAGGGAPGTGQGVSGSAGATSPATSGGGAGTTQPGSRQGSAATRVSGAESISATSTASGTTTTGGTGSVGSGGASAPPVPPGTVAGTGQAEAAEFLTRLRRLAAQHPVALLPYSDPDTVAMVRGGAASRLAELVRLGLEVTTRVLPSSLLSTVALPPGGVLDPATIAVLAKAGYRSAVLEPTTLAPRGTATGSVSVPSGVAGLPALRAAVADSTALPAIRSMTSGSPNGSAPAQVNALAALLAQQALSHIRSPLVIAPDHRWSLNARGITALTTLLARLRNAGGTAPASLDVVTGVPGGSDSTPASVLPLVQLRYSSAARAAELSAGYLGPVASRYSSIVSATGAFLRETGTNQPSPATILRPLATALDPAYSSAWRSDPATPTAVLRTIDATLSGLAAGLSIVTPGGSYTLGSDTAPLIITVHNSLPYAARFTLVIIGGQRAGLKVSDPGVQLISAGRSRPVRVPATVSRSGTFEVRVQLYTPDGSPLGSRTAITVASSAYGTVTLVIIAVAGAVLLLMVILRVVQRIQGRSRLDPTDRISGPAGPAGAGDRPAGPGGGPDEPGAVPGPGEQPDPPQPAKDSILAAAARAESAPTSAGDR